ncbi:MAG: hypothetical protein EPO07_00850 [Verrucomicrobia bacterium]|nr:MAG: hypothetical protein EPO07_00850 [Verrucomicrobiota bacterium]
MNSKTAKRFINCLLLGAFVISTVALTGCGKSSDGAENLGLAKADDQPELAAMLKAFDKADVQLKAGLEETARMVRSGMTADALGSLKLLVANPKLTAEQKQAVERLINRLKTN